MKHYIRVLKNTRKILKKGKTTNTKEINQVIKKMQLDTLIILEKDGRLRILSQTGSNKFLPRVSKVEV